MADRHNSTDIGNANEHCNENHVSATDPRPAVSAMVENACLYACNCSANDLEHTDQVKSLEADDATHSETSSTCGDCLTKGDEGSEEHCIEVGDMGFHHPTIIERTLAQHRRAPLCSCNCHHEGTHDYLLNRFPPFNFPMATSDMLSPAASDCVSPADSMIVEPHTSSSGSENINMTSSLHSNLSRRSSTIHFAGEWVNQAVNLPAVFNPLQPTPETHFRYPFEINISQNDLRDLPGFDLW